MRGQLAQRLDNQVEKLGEEVRRGLAGKGSAGGGSEEVRRGSAGGGAFIERWMERL